MRYSKAPFGLFKYDVRRLDVVVVVVVFDQLVFLNHSYHWLGNNLVTIQAVRGLYFIAASREIGIPGINYSACLHISCKLSFVFSSFVSLLGLFVTLDWRWDAHQQTNHLKNDYQVSSKGKSLPLVPSYNPWF